MGHGFLSRFLPELHRTMTTGWQPPAVNTPSPTETRKNPPPSDHFSRSALNRAPLPSGNAVSPGPPGLAPPDTSFFSRFLLHGAASSNFPDAIADSDLALLEHNPSSSTPHAGTQLPGLPTAPEASRFSFFRPRTDSDWMRTMLMSASLGNFPDAVTSDDFESIAHSSSDDSQFATRGVAALFMSQKHSIADKLRLGTSTALALKLEQQFYLPTDQTIAGDKFRHETTQELQSRGDKITWSETSGVAEIGTGKSGTIALGSLGKAQAGFKGSALVQYRTLRPVAQHGNDAPPAQTQSTFLPREPGQLMGLEAGTEFEVQGAATVTGHASASAGPSRSLGPVSVGATASLGTSIIHEGELSLNLKVLDSRGIVLVTITKGEEQTSNLTANLFAGLSSNLNLPKVGNGILRHIVENELTRPIAHAVRDHGSVSAGMLGRSAQKSENIATYTVDLTSPNGVEACRSLMNLSTGTAARLSEIEGSGVTSSRLDSTTNSDAFRAHVSYGGKKLFLHEKLKLEREASFQGSGKRLLYRENQFHEKTGNPITGNKEVSWNAVSVEKPGTGNDSTFFNMKLAANKLFTSKNAIQRFLTFTNELTREYQGPVDAELPEMSTLDRLFSDRDNTKIDVDIYFTQEGIAHIDAAEAQGARRAYFQAQEKLVPESTGLMALSEADITTAESLATRYAQAQTERYLPDSGAAFEISRLESQYANLTGRGLQSDYTILVGSHNFASQIKNFQGNKDPKKLRAFFQDLGAATEFEYMPTIAALASLAGQDETLVHQLKMTGPEIQIETVSEGMIAHPATTMATLMEASTTAFQGTPV